MATRNYTHVTLKRLYGRSGNCCAYPDCPVKLIDESNLSDVCHIEALNPEGARYNDDPEISDKDRNDHPNLILFCKNHHHIIDHKDPKGKPLYDVIQLKAMKQSHEEKISVHREAMFRKNAPSLLAQIVQRLSKYQDSNEPTSHPLSFEINEKIFHNAIERYKGIIDKYAAYSPVLDRYYNELEAGQMKKVLGTINDLYLKNRLKKASSDDILDRVLSALIDRIEIDGVLEYSEDLETCAQIVMVDAFMRCKILKGLGS